MALVMASLTAGDLMICRTRFVVVQRTEFSSFLIVFLIVCFIGGIHLHCGALCSTENVLGIEIALLGLHSMARGNGMFS